MWYLLLPLLQVSVAAGDWERVWSIAHAPERLAWETRHVGEWLSVTKDVLQPRVLSEEGVLFDGPEWALAAVQTDMRVAAATTDVLEQVATFLPPHNHSVARIGGRWYRRADALDFTLLPDEVLLRRSGDRTRWIHTGASGWNYIDLLETESPLKRPTFKLKASSDEKNDVATVLSVREDWSGRFVVTAKLETAGLCIDALQEWYQEQYRNGAQIPVVMYPPQTIQWKLPGLTEDQQPAWGVYETVACPKKAAKPTLRSAGSPLHEDVATIMSAGYTEGGELAFSHFIVDAKLEAAGICISSEPSQANVELYRVGAELPVEYDSSQMRIDFQPGSLGASGEYGVISCPRPNALRSSKLGASEIVVLDEPATILLIEILEETKLNVLARLENTDKCIAVILDVPVRDMGDSNPVQVYVDPQDHFVTFMTQWMPSGTYRDVECPRQAVRGTSVTPYVYINSASPDNRALTLGKLLRFPADRGLKGGTFRQRRCDHAYRRSTVRPAPRPLALLHGPPHRQPAPQGASAVCGRLPDQPRERRSVLQRENGHEPAPLR